jgi:hypothetical protein
MPFSKPNIFPLFAKSIQDSASSVKTVAFGWENEKRAVFAEYFCFKDGIKF